MTMKFFCSDSQGAGKLVYTTAAAAFLLYLLAGTQTYAVPYATTIGFPAYTNRTEILTNFPVLLVFSNGFGGGSTPFNYNQMVSPNGWDLRIRDANDTTNLNYEIESWNTNGTSCVWVQIPALTGDGNSSILVDWGDPFLSTQLACTTNGSVWDSHYRAVWHLQSATGSSVPDSTAYGHTGTPVNSPTQTTGIAGYGLNFNGSSQYVDCGTSNDLSQLTTAFTLEASGRAGTLSRGDSHDLFTLLSGTDHAGNMDYGIRVDASVPKFWIMDNNSANYISVAAGATVSAGARNVYSAIFDKNAGSGNMRLLINGAVAAAGTGSYAIKTSYGGHLDIGRNYHATVSQYWNGMIDEVRISDIARSTNWLWASHRTMASNATFSVCTEPWPVILDGVAPLITNSSLVVTGWIAQPFNYQMAVTGTAPMVYSASGLPGGLQMTAGGLVYGSPSVPGSFPVELTVSNRWGSDTRTLELTVIADSPVITSPLSAGGQVGQYFAYTITVTGSPPLTCSAAGLPAGVLFDGTRSIYGVPQNPGSFEVSLSAANPWGSTTQTLSLSVQDAQPVPTNLPCWLQQQQLTYSVGCASDDSSADYGYAVSVSGSHLAVSAPGTPFNGSYSVGAVYMYEWNGSAWVLNKKLMASDYGANSAFGNTLSLSGNRLAVGSPNKPVGTNTYQGAVYIFDWDGSTWSQTARLTASDGASYDFFGGSISLSGTRLLVGAPQKTVGTNSYQGAVYVFDRIASTWTQTGRLTSSDGAYSDYFGKSVAVSSNRAVIGASSKMIAGINRRGAAYVFECSGTNWTQTAHLLASDGSTNHYFGCAVAMEGNRIAVGAYYANSYRGATYVFDWNGAAWEQTAALTAADLTGISYFGNSLSLSGNRLLVGAYTANKPGGLAYMFDWNGSTWTQSTRLSAADAAAGDSFGMTVSMDGTCAAVGAYGRLSKGAAYVFALGSGPDAAPAAFNQTLSAIAGGPRIPVPLSYLDPDDGQPASFRLVSPPTRGVVGYYIDGGTSTLNTNVWVNRSDWYYQPTGTTACVDSFCWQAYDGTILSLTACATINVLAPTAPNSPPLFKAGVPLMDGTNAMRVFRQTLGNKFQYAAFNRPAYPLPAPEVTDWNNDGLMDLIVGQSDGRVALFLNKGTLGHPVFNGYSYLCLPSGINLSTPGHGCSCFGSAPVASTPRVVDWNNDGKKDLVIGSWAGLDPISMHVGFLAGSGMRDDPAVSLFVLLNAGTDEAPVFTNGYRFPFVSSIPDSYFSGGRPTSMPWITDMNGDGIPDVISGENNIWFSQSGMYGNVGAASGLINVFYGSNPDHTKTTSFVAGAETVPPSMTFTGACPAQSRKSVVAADFSGSGKKDLLIGMQDGTIWFSPNVGTAQLPVFNSCTRLQAGGQPIIVGDPAQLGQDPGYANAPSDRHGGDFMNMGNEARIAVGDLDGDGLQDLVVGTVYGYITVFYQYNPQPAAIDQKIRVMPNHAKAVTLTAKVDSGSTPVFTIISQPLHGTLSGSSSNYIYTPYANYIGSDSFTFRANADGFAGRPAAVSLTVKAHTPETVETCRIMTGAGVPYPVTLSATDEGDEPLDWNIIQPLHGTVSGTPPNLSYRSDTNYSGPDCFAWNVTDGYTVSAMRTVTVDVARLAVNFQPAGFTVPAGYLPDCGDLFDSGRGYGWNRADYMGGWMSLQHMGPYPQNFPGDADPRFATSVYAFTTAVWMASVPNGTYEVIAGYGNRSQAGNGFADVINIQGTTVVNRGEGQIWDPAVVGTVNATAIVTDGVLTVTIASPGGTVPTRLDYIEIHDQAVYTPSAQATFITLDAVTKGNWQGVYGSDGSVIPGSGTRVPVWAQLDLSGSAQVSADPSADSRALQHLGYSTRISSYWAPSSGTSFVHQLQFVDGATHRAALYFWNGTVETVDVLDGADGSVLDSRSASGASNGVYLVWDIKGSVSFRITRTGGIPSLTGIFLGSGAGQDYNSDSLPDGWQIRYFGSYTSASAAPDADPDSDGFTNLQEFRAGTNPLDGTSYPVILGATKHEPGGMVLTWPSAAGRTYSIDGCTNLTEGFRLVVGSGIQATPAVNCHTVQVNQASQHYFRVRLEE